MKFFKYLFLVVLFFTFFTVARADNSFIFSTDVQNIPVNQISGKINIQAQSPVVETTYLSFTSSSGTGQFLNSSGNPLTSAYISKGDSNRAVYYEDSTAGDFVISVDILNKDKTKITTISQHIFVGDSVSAGTDTTSTTTDQTTTITPTDQNTHSSSFVSAHSSPAPLSDTEEKIEFEVSAGRDRLTIVGNSLVFRAVPTKFQNIPETGITYQWSFGDGTTATGNNVSHTYKFAGDYVVVVNANYSDKQAVSRMQVRVISPNTTINKIPEGVEILNNSSAEINLEGWSLVSPKKVFVFPPDTLIPSGKKVIFADSVTGMSEDIIQLINPIGKEFGLIKKVETKEPEFVATNETGVSIDDIQAKIEEVKNEVAIIEGLPLDTLNKTELQTELLRTEGLVGGNVDLPILISTSTENTAVVFEATEQKGFVSTIFSWPIRGFNFIRRLFIEE